MEDRALGSATKWAFQIFSNSVRFSGIGLARRGHGLRARGPSKKISQSKFCTGPGLEQVPGRDDRDEPAPHLGRPKANNTMGESRIHLSTGGSRRRWGRASGKLDLIVCRRSLIVVEVYPALSNFPPSTPSQSCRQ